MVPLLPLSESVALSVLLIALCSLLVRALALGERQQRIASAVLVAALLVQAAGCIDWSRGHGLGVTVVWTLIPVLACALLALPFSLIVRHAPRFSGMSPEPRSDLPGPRLTRRAALALPLFAGAGAAVCLHQGQRVAELRELALGGARLPPALRGLRILQLSDLHLGTGLEPRDLKQLLARAAPLRPDLVVLTGDVADRLDALVAALPLFAQFAAPLGTYAVLGNHEYMSGALDRMVKAYAESTVILLVNEARTLQIGDARLNLIGIDDPFGKYEEDFFGRCLFECDPGAGAGFRLLLSHRPDALDAAAARGIDLVLSGHTHGGQIGWWGRSLFERLGIAQRMWGVYRAGATQLYTSAGAGDWFPFRVNCPREAPVITLTERK